MTSDEKTAKVQAQIQQVKGVVIDNLQIVIDRNEKIEALEGKAAGLNESSELFLRNARKLSWKQWLELWKWRLLLVFVILVGIGIFALVIWAGTR